jgi:hypothetical protein
MIDVFKMAGVVTLLAGGCLLLAWYPVLYAVPLALLCLVLWLHS